MLVTGTKCWDVFFKLVSDHVPPLVHNIRHPVPCTHDYFIFTTALKCNMGLWMRVHEQSHEVWCLMFDTPSLCTHSNIELSNCKQAVVNLKFWLLPLVLQHPDWSWTRGGGGETKRGHRATNCCLYCPHHKHNPAHNPSNQSLQFHIPSSVQSATTLLWKSRLPPSRGDKVESDWLLLATLVWMCPTISVEEVGFLRCACPTTGSWVREGKGGLSFGLQEGEDIFLHLTVGL